MPRPPVYVSFCATTAELSRRDKVKSTYSPASVLGEGATGQSGQS